MTPLTCLQPGRNVLRKWVELGYLNRFRPGLRAHVKGAKWVEPGFDPLWNGPCERGLKDLSRGQRYSWRFTSLASFGLPATKYLSDMLSTISHIFTMQNIASCKSRDVLWHHIIVQELSPMFRGGWLSKAIRGLHFHQLKDLYYIKMKQKSCFRGTWS